MRHEQFTIRSRCVRLVEHYADDVRAMRDGVGVEIVPRLPSQSVGERYGVVLVPITEVRLSADDIVAERENNGWRLVSKRMDRYGAEVIVFRQPA